MPVRIYDIAKKLGLESKDVIAKAKELGITAAKVPSSSLDKITAEFLEERMGGRAPAAEAPKAVEAVIIVKTHEPEPVQVVAQPPVQTFKPVDIETPVLPVIAPEPEHIAIVAPAPAPLVTQGSQPEPVKVITPLPESVQKPISPTAPEPTPAPILTPNTAVVHVDHAPKTAEPPSPVAPAPKPQLGDLVGRVVLPPKPGPRTTEKAGSAKPPPPRPAQTGQRPFDNRGQQGQVGGGARPGQNWGNRGPQGQGFQARPGQQQGARPGSSQQGGGRGEPARPPSDPRFTAPANAKIISLKPPIVVRDLAEKLGKKPFQLIADLMELGVFANVNQAIDETVAVKLAGKHGFKFEAEKRDRGAGQVHATVRKVDLDDDKPEDLKPRAPVVTIMGHVDHGKTTLLDVIRKASVASGEAGGITQHIGAYTISIPHPENPANLQQITFLDTPGHAAFSSMRARGANVTDIVVLVVAANDGVMPQTLEALSHAQAAKVPIIVAVNKCDHPSANPMRVRQQLQDRGLVCEEWGGETIFVDTSALAKQGIDKLLQMIVLQAEVLELKANPGRRAKGNVIESGLEPGGPTATVLVRKGTLRLGDIVICGPFYGKVRALINEEGNRLEEAGPSVAVKLLGLNGVPEAGVEFAVLENEKAARALAEEREMEGRALENERQPRMTMESFFHALNKDGEKVMKVVVKADTQGSVEAIVEALRKIESTKVSLDIIHDAVGTITTSDVSLASASKAVVLGFHTRIDNGVSAAAKREGVQIKLYAIIYELIDQVKEAMAGLLDPLLKEVVVGTAEVRKVFELSKGGNVAGCFVTNGRLVKGKMRVNRRKGLIYEGLSQSLRRFQDEVNEVRSGMECGIRLDGFDDYQVGDTIECYTVEKFVQTL